MGFTTAFGYIFLFFFNQLLNFNMPVLGPYNYIPLSVCQSVCLSVLPSFHRQRLGQYLKNAFSIVNETLVNWLSITNYTFPSNGILFIQRNCYFAVWHYDNVALTSLFCDFNCILFLNSIEEHLNFMHVIVD